MAIIRSIETMAMEHSQMSQHRLELQELPEAMD
jgi:hypothetical protein